MQDTVHADEYSRSRYHRIKVTTPLKLCVPRVKKAGAFSPKATSVEFLFGMCQEVLPTIRGCEWEIQCHASSCAMFGCFEQTLLEEGVKVMQRLFGVDFRVGGMQDTVGVLLQNLQHGPQVILKE